MIDDQLNTEKFEELLTKLKASGGMEAFQTDPLPMLRNERIDVLTEADLLGPDRSLLSGNETRRSSIQPHAALAESEKVWADMNWWGVRIYLNDPACRDLNIGSGAATVLAPLAAGAVAGAGILTAGAAAVVGSVLAAIFVLKAAEIAIMNNGKGVYFPITWLQWAPIIALFPGSPPSIAAAAALIHPLRIS